MALAKQSLVIDSDTFIKGLTTSQNLIDGGMSPETDCINLLANPGVLYPSPAATSLGAISGHVIASCYDTISTTINPVTRFLLTDSPVLYSLVGSTLNSLGTPGYTIVEGLSDLQIYGYSGGTPAPILWFTTTAGIVHTGYVYSTSSLTGGYTLHTPTGWTSYNPHPMIVFNEILYYADGPYLHTYNGSSYTDEVLTLQADQVITALSIDPGTGKMMLGISSRGYLYLGDNTTTYNSPQFIGLYDGTNPTQLVRKIPVDGTVTSLQNCGGYMFVAYGNCIGVWNGNGISFLRRIPINSNVGLQFQNIYKNKISNYDNLLLYLSNNEVTNQFLVNSPPNKIMAYGEIQAGVKAFFPIVDLPGGNQIDFVANINQGSILYSCGGELYSLFLPGHSTVFNTGDSSPIFVSMRYGFPRPATITQIRIFYEDPVLANGLTLGSLAIIDDSQGVTFSQNISNPSGGSTMAWFDVFPQVKTTEFRIKYHWLETTTCHGIQKMIVFYNFVE